MIVVVFEEPPVSVMVEVVFEEPLTVAAWLPPAPDVCVTVVSVSDNAFWTAEMSVRALVLESASWLPVAVLSKSWLIAESLEDVPVISCSAVVDDVGVPPVY